MAITLNTLVYDQDSWLTKDKVTYRGPSHTDSVEDSITLGRTSPKPTADFAGVSRSQMKRVKTYVDGGGKALDVIINVEVSKPVGVPDAFMDGVRDDMGDLLVSTVAQLVCNKHDITH